MPDASPAEERGDARAPRATRYWMLVVGLLAAAAWCWRGLLEISFTGEDLLLIQQQADGFARTGTVFRPLWHAWFWLGERMLGSEDPRPWHAAQLGLHLVNAALVAAVARALRLAVLPALAATALFALGAGCADSLCWIAACNRQLSACGALVCVLGLVRYDHGPRWGWIALAGFAFQFGSNEEVYGSALLATGCLLWLAWKPARRRDPRAWLVCLLPAAAIALHFLLLRGSGGSSVLSGGSLAALVFEQAPRNAQARLAEIAAGWLASADELDALALVVLGCSLSWMQRERQRACVVAGYLLCSCVPFALEGGSRYRDYPTLAPLALALGLLVDSLLLYVPAAPALARRALGVLALVAALAAGWSARAEALAAWREATAELESCRAPLLELARRPGAPAPLLVNLETGTRSLLRAFPDFTHDALLAHPTLAFLDTPHACAPPPQFAELAADSRGLWGRRADGSHGEIDAAELLARPRIDEWKLYATVRTAASYSEARALLASGAVDPRDVAVVEAAPGSIEAEAGARLEPGDVLRVAVPLAIDAAALRASIELDIECARERWLVAQPPFLYSDLLRFGPDYARLGRVADPRAVRATARIDGARVEQVLRAQGCGFALRVPAGAHRVALSFDVQPVALSAR